MISKFPQIGMYSALSGSGSPLLNNDGTINYQTISLQARWQTVILDVYAPKHRPDILQALRAANPSIRLIGYVVMLWWDNPHPALSINPEIDDFARRFYLRVRDTNGFLCGVPGPYSEVSNTNLANSQTASQLADLIIEDIIRPGLWDGLFLDVMIPEFMGPADVDISRCGFTDADAFMTSWKTNARSFAEKIRNACSKGFPIIGNYGPGGFKDLFNGWMRENFPYQNCYDQRTGWSENVLNNYWDQSGYLANDHEYMWQGPTTMNWLVSNPGYNQEASKQKMRFGLATATLGNGIHSFARLETEPRRFWWYPEYDLDLGQPLSNAMINAGGTWIRIFEKGAVAVNPTYKTRSCYLNDIYYLCVDGVRQGTSKKAFPIPARDAIFLVK